MRSLNYTLTYIGNVMHYLRMHGQYWTTQLAMDLASCMILTEALMEVFLFTLLSTPSTREVMHYRAVADDPSSVVFNFGLFV
mgnify:CR=1 FL=1